MSKLIIYLPKRVFPEQSGPLCYYFSLIRAIEFQNKNYISLIPAVCKRIATQIAAAHKNFTASDDILFDDVVDEIFLNNLNDKIIKELDLTDSEGQIDTVDDFMSTFSHSQRMALLFNFDYKENFDVDFTINYFSKLLRAYGPLPFDGSFSLPKMLDNTKKGGELLFDAYFVDYQLVNDQHTILVIGCQEVLPSRIFYIDPNFPNVILSILFSEFKQRVLDSRSIVHTKLNNLMPTIDTFTMKTVRESSKFFDDSIKNNISTDYCTTTMLQREPKNTF
jgi:hypothetical protein